MERASSVKKNDQTLPPEHWEASGHVNDETIIGLYFKRTEEAILCTKAKYGALCRSVARRILPDERDVDECENDVYIRVWKAIPPDRPKSLKAYLARVTRNLALDRYVYNTAAQRSTALTEAFEELETSLPSSAEDPNEFIDAEHFREVINAFLRRQQQEARIIFIRRYWYGESVKEIAEALKIGEPKVKTSLFRTRNRLKEELMKERIEL